MLARPMSAREVALKALKEIDEKKAYANLVLDGVLRRFPLEGRDRGLATELVYGVARRQGTLDWALDLTASRPVSQMEPWVRAILREGAYQLMFLDKIPPHAALSEAVELAKQYGHAGTAKFVNAVLRSLQRKLPDLPFPAPEQDLIRHLALRHSHPEWMVRLWTERYGPAEAAALMEAMNAVPPLTIRVNRLKGSREQLISLLAREGVTAVPTRWSPEGLTLQQGTGEGALDRLAAFRAGWFAVQDESSMLVAPALTPMPGETVLDVAAAPGGKATHLAELMDNRGRVIALDVHPHKLALIRETARRLGAEIVAPVQGDARQVHRLLPDGVDRVLVDAPCSGLGTLGRRPDARWRKQPEDSLSLAQLQLEILDSAAQVLRPGGVLVYSTCTIERRENQGVVAAFLAAHPEFEADDVWPYLPVGLWREPSLPMGCVQLLPHRHKTDGFFLTRLEKKGPAEDYRPGGPS